MSDDSIRPATLRSILPNLPEGGVDADWAKDAILSILAQSVMQPNQDAQSSRHKKDETDNSTSAGTDLERFRQLLVDRNSIPPRQYEDISHTDLAEQDATLRPPNPSDVYPHISEEDVPTNTPTNNKLLELVMRAETAPKGGGSYVKKSTLKDAIVSYIENETDRDENVFRHLVLTGVTIRDEAVTFQWSEHTPDLGFDVEDFAKILSKTGLDKDAVPKAVIVEQDVDLVRIEWSFDDVEKDLQDVVSEIGGTPEFEGTVTSEQPAPEDTEEEKSNESDSFKNVSTEAFVSSLEKHDLDLDEECHLYEVENTSEGVKLHFNQEDGPDVNFTVSHHDLEEVLFDLGFGPFSEHPQLDVAFDGSVVFIESLS